MLIRKLFKFEGSHIVRDCTSERCSKSIHGHSYVVEIFLTSTGLDNGQMVVDFGLLKGTVKDFIDAFDHTHVSWVKESEEVKNFFRKHNERWIELPCSPSAEMFSLMFFFVIDRIIKNTVFNNGEKFVSLYAVRVHETATGYAESSREDLESLWRWDLEDIIISQPIMDEWKDSYMWSRLIENDPFINPSINLKYNKNE